MTDNARGVMLFESHYRDGGLLSLPKGIDFVVAVAMFGMKEQARFSDHVQEAHNAGIPCIALVDVDVDVYSSAFSLANPKWEDVDHKYTDILDRLFLSPDGSMTKAFQAIMLDIRTVDSTNSGAWIVETARHLRSLFQKRYFNKPVYFLTHQVVLEHYPNASDNPQVWLSKQPMLCTYSRANLVQTIPFRIPVEPYNPIPNWQGIKFWWYGDDDVVLHSGSGEDWLTPLFQYESDIAHLHAELGFTPANVPTPPTPPTPPAPVPTEDDVIEIEIGKVYKIRFVRGEE